MWGTLAPAASPLFMFSLLLDLTVWPMNWPVCLGFQFCAQGGSGLAFEQEYC